MTRTIPALLAIAAAFAWPVAASAAASGAAPGPISDTACGKAPSGELVAQRVEAVKPSRKEAGLYEGPVWVKDALYFSDFAFSQGFPSRIRKLAADGSVSTLTEDGGIARMARCWALLVGDESCNARATRRGTFSLRAAPST